MKSILSRILFAFEILNWRVLLSKNIHGNKSRLIHGLRISKYFCRCYLVDNSANLVTDPDFLEANITDEREYQRVSLGRKEGEIMKEFVQERKFFEQTKRFDYQGMCSVSPYFPKVSWLDL